MKILSYIVLVGVLSSFQFVSRMNISKYAIDEKPVVRIDDHLQGIWKLAEDTDMHNYFVIEKESDFNYAITYMDHGGNNRGLEHFRGFFSEIGNVKFVSLPNWVDEERGYVLLKIDEITAGSWNLTASLVTDPSIRYVSSREDLRMLLAKNVNNSKFYSPKKLHFRKRFEFNSFR